MLIGCFLILFLQFYAVRNNNNIAYCNFQIVYRWKMVIDARTKKTKLKWIDDFCCAI